MAIYIEIKKISETKDLIFYRVSTNNFNVKDPFFIGIDLTNKYVHFYKEKHFETPFFSISLEHPTIPKNEWIDSGLIARILSAIINALRRGALGEYISYAI